MAASEGLLSIPGHLRSLVQHRDLLVMWTQRDIKVRYRQSLLGGVWAILQPLSLMVVFSVVFTYFVKIPSDGVPYPIFSYSGLLPWTFLNVAVSFGVPSLTQNINLVTKVHFPREILPLSAIAAALVDFLVASVVFVGMMVVYRVPFSGWLLLLPVLLAIQIILVLGVVLFASAVNVFYRDVRFVVPLALQIWMYATPVIYPASLVPGSLKDLYMLNPMVGLIEAYRAIAVLGQAPDWKSLAVGAVMSVLICVLGYTYFKHVEDDFADLI